MYAHAHTYTLTYFDDAIHLLRDDVPQTGGWEGLFLERQRAYVSVVLRRENP